MATLTDTTSWAFDKSTGVTSQTVTLHSAATAGMTLVLVSTGGAQVNANLTTGGGTAFTRRTQALGALAASVADVVCAGGETQVVLTLNGAENISGIIYHFASLGAFIAAGNNGAGTSMLTSTDFTALSGAIAVTQNAVLVSVTSLAGTITSSVLDEFKGLGPLGAYYANTGHQTGTGTKFVWATGLHDITAAGNFPASQPAGSYKAATQWLAGSGTNFVAAAAYADSSGLPTNPAPVNSCVAENSLPGVSKTNWFVQGTSTNGSNDSTVAGFCDKLSYAPGDTVNFKVDSTSNPFHVEIYRLGYYSSELFAARNQLGVGTGADAGYITGTPAVQAAPSVDGTLGSTSCAAWTTTASWTIPSNAQSGIYFVVFRRTDVTTHSNTTAFIVHPASVKGKVAFCAADFTWHAYNVWGATTDNGPITTGTWTGRSVYQIGTDANVANIAHRAYAVCFDRPYSTASTDLVTWALDTEQPLLAFLEAQGYDMVYYSNADLENDTTETLLTTAKAVCLVGHQEYWTTNVYNSHQAAMNAGVPYMIQSSNTALWHTRFAVADTNKRTMICYKDSMSVDVSAGFDGGTGRDPVSYTGTWRDSRTGTAPNNSDVRRENALTGQLFMISGLAANKISVPFAQKGLPIWRNSTGVTGLVSGSYAVNIPGNSTGFEVDAPDGSAGQPPNLVQLNPYSSGSVGNFANAAGDKYTTTATVGLSFTLYRRGASRALVFNTGVWDGWWGVTRWAKSGYGGGAGVTTPDLNWQNALLAVMYDLGCPPNTLQAMAPVTDTVPTDPATGAPALSTDKTGVARAYGLACPEDGQFMAAMV